MQRAYPVEARRAMTFWMIAMVVVALAAMLVAWRLEAPGTKDATVKMRAGPLAPPAVKSLYMTKTIWDATNGCKAMRTLYDEEVCGEYAYTLSSFGITEAPRDHFMYQTPRIW